MLSFHQAMQSELEAVNQTILKELHSDVELVENIGQYIIDAGGKRLRPLLVLIMAKNLGYDGAQHIDLATIIEFIHTATLLHDDVVDMSTLRRGRATANQKWGNAPSVLVGDFLYSRAFQLMVRVGNMPIMNIMANTTNVIAEGEVMQLANAGNPSLREEDYMTVIYKKTAALFEAACETAAVLSGQDNAICERAKLIGYHLGVAFQLVDDALDYNGDPESLGKNLGDDLAEGKATLPLIYAREQGSPEEAQTINNALVKGDTAQLDSVIAIVQRHHALDYTYNQARFHAEQAKNLIKQLPANAYRDLIDDLADFSVARSY